MVLLAKNGVVFGVAYRHPTRSCMGHPLTDADCLDLLAAGAWRVMGERAFRDPLFRRHDCLTLDLQGTHFSGEYIGYLRERRGPGRRNWTCASGSGTLAEALYPVLCALHDKGVRGGK